MAGCRAVSIPMAQTSCCYLKDELGFDAAIDHRGPDFESGKFLVFYKLNPSICRLVSDESLSSTALSLCKHSFEVIFPLSGTQSAEDALLLSLSP